MKISFSPTRSEIPLSLERHGDVLTINGEDFDFSVIPEGASLPREAVHSDWLASDVERLGGVLQLVLILPHGANAPEKTRFPVPLELTQDGTVTLPLYDTPIEEDEE